MERAFLDAGAFWPQIPDCSLIWRRGRGGKGGWERGVGEGGWVGGFAAFPAVTRYFSSRDIGFFGGGESFVDMRDEMGCNLVFDWICKI